jgi:hypothetical protein
MHKRWPVLLPVAVWLFAGCAGPTPAAPKGKSAAPVPARPVAPPVPVIEPVQAFSGKVVLVNGPLKYVVVEGVLGRLPPAEQTLNIYRDGQKVGVAVVSGQSRGANFAADLSEGEARVGDTVRSD